MVVHVTVGVYRYRCSAQSSKLVAGCEVCGRFDPYALPPQNFRGCVPLHIFSKRKQALGVSRSCRPRCLQPAWKHFFWALFSRPHLRKRPFLSPCPPCVSSPACASCLSLAGAETGASPALSCRSAHRVPRGPQKADADRNGVSCNRGASACDGRGAASAARCAQGADP